MKTKIIRVYYLFMLLQGLAISCFFATSSLFLVEKGLSLLEINLLNASYMLAYLFFEIPTGVNADYFGKKRSILFGLWIFVFSFLIYYLSNHFWQFLVAEILGALAFTCISGALEGLVIEKLEEENYSGTLTNVFRKAEIRAVGVIIGANLGSIIGQFDLSWPWLMSSLSFAVLAIISSLYLPSDLKDSSLKLKFSFLPLKQIAQESISYSLKNRRFIYMVIFSAILFFSIQPLNMYWTIILKDTYFIEVKYMGLIFSFIVIFIYLGSQFSIWWQKRFKCPKKAIYLSQIITAISLIFASLLSPLYLFLIFFMFHEFGRGLFKPLSRAYVNGSIVDKNRSTVLSFESMIVKSGGALGLIFSGFIANNWGILNSWIINGIILFIAILIFYRKNNFNS
jgi:MFS family permease